MIKVKLMFKCMVYLVISKFYLYLQPNLCVIAEISVPLIASHILYFRRPSAKAIISPVLNPVDVNVFAVDAALASSAANATAVVAASANYSADAAEGIISIYVPFKSLYFGPGFILKYNDDLNKLGDSPSIRFVE